MKSLRAARKADRQRGRSSGRLEKRRKSVAAATDGTMQDANTISAFGIHVAKNSFGWNKRDLQRTTSRFFTPAARSVPR
jgi:hypothetical protein